MAKPVSLEIPSFHGGVDLFSHRDKVPAHKARSAENLVMEEWGSVAKRLGLRLVATIASKVSSAHVFQRQNQQTQILVQCTDGSVRYSIEPYTTWTTIWTALSNIPMSFVTFQDVVFMTNGSDLLRSWNGTTGTTYPSAPSMRYLAIWKDLLWGATSSWRVYASAPGDGTTWPVANWVDVARGQGGKNMGITDSPNGVAIFRENARLLIYDPVEFDNRIVDPDQGLVDFRSIVHSGGRIYFVSPGGVCLYREDGPSEVLSRNIQPLFGQDAYQIEDFIGYQTYNRVGWSTPYGGGSNTTQFEFYPDYPESPWLSHTMRLLVLIQVPRAEFDEHELYGFDHTDGRFYEVYDHTQVSATTQDNGVTYTAFWQTGWFDFGTQLQTKLIERLQVVGRGQFFIDIYTDFNETTVVKTLPVAVASDTGRVEVIELLTEVYCRAISFKFRDASIDSEAIDIPLTTLFPPQIFIGDFELSRVQVFGKVLGIRQ